MRKDHLLVGLMALTWSIVGAIDPHVPDDGATWSVTAFPHAVTLSILQFAWCKAHASAHGIRPPTGAALLVGLFGPIGAPYYFFRGFGLGKGALFCLIAVCFLVACLMLYVFSFRLSAQFLA